MNTKEWLNSLEWDYGFDRFSSHNLHEYVDMTIKLKDYLHPRMIEDLAEAIDFESTY